jgi:predicted DNA-binding protein with PD1-like motif
MKGYAMEGYRDGDKHFLRLDRGEDLAAGITAYCDEKGIRNAQVAGIGAVEDVELGYYDLDARQYLRCRPKGIFELLSLAGNVTQVDGRAFLHAHAVLAGRDLSLTGGHFFGGRIAVTGEIHIVETRLGLTRAMNEDVGLKLVVKEGSGSC